MRTVFPAALALLLPTMVAAQSTSITPSFSVSEKYDDNLYVSASHPERTLVHGFGPRLDLERRSPLLSLSGHYTLDAEYLQDLPAQGLLLARQLGSITLGYQPMKRLTLKADAAYLDTRTSVELNTATVVDRGYVRARRLSVGPSMAYAFDRRTQGGLGYTFSQDHLLGLTTDAHLANAGLAYRFARLDTGSADLLVRKFVFDGAQLPPSEVALLGWTHRFARRASAALHAGPRFRRAAAEGVEVAASLRQGVGRADLEASYTRAETATSGLPGSFETDAALLSATLKWKPSVFSANAGFARTHGAGLQDGAGLQADVLHGRIAALTRVTPWLSAELALSVSWQHLQTEPATRAASAAAIGGLDRRVFHDIAALTFVVAPPKPLEL